MAVRAAGSHSLALAPHLPPPPLQLTVLTGATRILAGLGCWLALSCSCPSPTAAATTAHRPASGASGSDPYHGRLLLPHPPSPDVSPPPAPPSTTPTSQLDHLIAHTFHRAPLRSFVTFMALMPSTGLVFTPL
ncbi:hypothetical protein EI94DRAFT_1809205 [Lactarius quietus]|nr:hypothetical protein EI94DRAFT_1809205 [Lactarius quietus]